LSLLESILRGGLSRIRRRISITRMEEAGVPVEKGMRITGHRDAKSYAKYRANDSEAKDRVCQDVISRTTSMVTGKYAQFGDMLQLEKDKQNLLKVISFIYLLKDCCFI
jgi:hypothetical protein